MLKYESRSNKQSSRDFLLVVTTHGEICTVRIREIQEIRPGHERGTTELLLSSEKGTLRLVIREGASAFQQRCDQLLLALQLQDCDLINQAFTPPNH